MLASRVLADGAGEDVGREPHCVGSRAVVTDFGLDYVAGALARPGEGKCAATAPKVIYEAPTAASHSRCSEETPPAARQHQSVEPGHGPGGWKCDLFTTASQWLSGTGCVALRTALQS